MIHIHICKTPIYHSLEFVEVYESARLLAGWHTKLKNWPTVWRVKMGKLTHFWHVGMLVQRALARGFWCLGLGE